MAPATTPVSEAFASCVECARIARMWHNPVPGTDHGPVPDADDPSITHARSSAHVLFGLHVQTEHRDQVEAPSPDPGCEECTEHTDAVGLYGPDKHAVCNLTTGELREQHLYGHLVEHVPVPAGATGRGAAA